MEDLIAAIATAPGEGGIGIIRVSGMNAVEVIDRIFSSPRGISLEGMATYQMAHGFICESNSEARIDEVLVSKMLGPHSFTGEDVVEINCHGGMLPLRKVLEEVLRVGARLAEPGEFSKRAFLNGRIDLTQAESIIDVIRSQTEMGLKVALQLLEGGLSQEIRVLRTATMEVMAFIEAGIDFPEDEVEELSREEIRQKVEKIQGDLGRLIKSGETGRIYREGLSAVIVGKPNVGKSSLLNALLREKRAIVTDIPGTTRDVIEEVLNLKGIPVRLVDTAGIRDTEDLVEKMGVEKTKEWFGMADLVLLVLDAQRGVDEQDVKIAELVEGQRCLVVVNKIDLAADEGKAILQGIDLDKLPSEFTGFERIDISVKEKIGLEKLEDNIAKLVLEGKVKPGEGVVISNVRHKRALEIAAGHIEGVLETLDMGMPTDCMAIDLKGALQAFGQVTGETIGEDIINEIFSQFCLGK